VSRKVGRGRFVNGFEWFLPGISFGMLLTRLFDFWYERRCLKKKPKRGKA
jgi:hypothetical protein